MSEKTEQPTPKRLRDAKKDGQVAKSKEVVSLLLLLGILGYCKLFTQEMLAAIITLIDLPNVLYAQFSQELNVSAVLGIFMQQFLLFLMPLLGLVFLIAIASNLMQTGLIFSAKPITPELKKISPAQGFKKIFCMKNLLELVKSLVKIIVLSATVYYLLRTQMATLLKIPHCGVTCTLTLAGDLVFQLIAYCLAVFVVLAILDWLMEVKQHKKQLMMSMDEVKREYKEIEGSSEIKGRRKQLHQELMNEQVKERVEKSDVIVVNPTHIAIGLRYRKEAGALPQVTIKGELANAKRIRQYAEQYHVPIVREVPLARAMYAQLDMDEFIDEAFFEPVAEVLRYIGQLQVDGAENHGAPQ